MADGGHYIAFVKKSAFAESAQDERDWYKFDDDDVSVFSKENVAALAGGGVLIFAFPSFLF